MSQLYNAIPLIHEEDSYLIEVEATASPHEVQIVSLQKFPNNLNCVPTLELFCDLDPTTKRKVVEQVNRRFPGKVVRV